MAKSQVIDRDRGWGAIKDRVKKAGKVAAKVGVLEAAGMHETDGEGEPMTVAQVAAVNEYGSSDGRVPERPAWRNSLDKNKPKITTALQRTAEQIVDGGIPVDVAMGRVGLLGQSLIRRGIDDLTTPPNAPLTIAMKGSSKPLIATSQTRNSVTYEIIKGAQVDEARKGGG